MSLCRSDVGGQLDIVKARRCDTAFDGPLHHVSVVLQPVVAGFVRRSADVFPVIDGLAAIFALTKLSCQPLDSFVELVDIVEGRNHDVPALLAFWVVAEVPHDPALNAVVVGIYRRHSRSLMKDSLEGRRLPPAHSRVHLVLLECADRKALLTSLTAHAVQK